MFELEINGQMIPFNFGMGFLREINRTVAAPVEGMQGVKQNIGLRYSAAKLLDHDVETLVDVLDLANKGCNPRITKSVLDAFIDNEDTNIEEVFEKTLGFFKDSKCYQESGAGCYRCSGKGEGKTGSTGEDEDGNGGVTVEEFYHNVALNCFRYLGFKSLCEVDRLTIPEYELMMEACQLKMVDDNYRVHWQAFLNFAVQAKRKAGKHKERPVYNRFDKFFNYEKEIKRIRDKKSEGKERFAGIGKFLRREGV